MTLFVCYFKQRFTEAVLSITARAPESAPRDICSDLRAIPAAQTKTPSSPPPVFHSALPYPTEDKDKFTTYDASE